jgi:hypothetical protein
MTRTLIVFALFAMVLLAYAGMRQGWTRRVSAQSDIAAPHALIAAPLLEGPWFGTYLGATHSGDWLDRIAVHTLGAKSHAEVTRTTEGINIVREGERSFSIPNAELVAVRAGKGIAGRAYEDDGIVVFAFRLGGTVIDAGFRFPNTDDHVAALASFATPTEVTP